MKENTKYPIFYEKGSNIMLVITEKGMKPENHQFRSYQEGSFPPPCLSLLLKEGQGAGIFRGTAGRGNPITHSVLLPNKLPSLKITFFIPVFLLTGCAVWTVGQAFLLHVLLFY